MATGKLLGVCLLLVMACDDDGSRGDPIGGASGSAGSPSTGGSAGTGGSAAGTGGIAGTGGSSASGGTGGSIDSPDASAPRIQAVIDGEFVRLSSEDPVGVTTCGENLKLSQQVDGAWIPLQDDRPDATNLEFESHYLDGVYRPYCQLTAGCDVSECLTIEEASDYSFDQQANLIPRELVQVGEGAAPTCERGDAGVPFDAGVDIDAGVQRVPAIESRAPRGPLAVRVRYYTSPSCQSPMETIDIPVE